MLLSKLSLGLCVIATLPALTACGGSDPQQPLPSPLVQLTPSITLISAYEVPQCAPARITPALLTKELTEAGVQVRASSCPFQPGITIASSCDAALPRYFMVDVPQDQELKVRTLGYKLVSAFPLLTANACPQ